MICCRSFTHSCPTTKSYTEGHCEFLIGWRVLHSSEVRVMCCDSHYTVFPAFPPGGALRTRAQRFVSSLLSSFFSYPPLPLPFSPPSLPPSGVDYVCCLGVHVVSLCAQIRDNSVHTDIPISARVCAASSLPATPFRLHVRSLRRFISLGITVSFFFVCVFSKRT